MGSDSCMGFSAGTANGLIRWSFILLVLTSALCAGLHTVADYDMGWQLATGRYVVQHHQIPSTDVTWGKRSLFDRKRRVQRRWLRAAGSGLLPFINQLANKTSPAKLGNVRLDCKIPLVRAEMVSNVTVWKRYSSQMSWSKIEVFQGQ